MRRRRNISRQHGQQGVVILLVAMFLLFVVGAMAVLAIDVVTFYTARSEAQIAADGAALAGARTMANSGMTSRPTDTTLRDNAKILATTIATQVAVQNKVGGRNLNATEVVVTFPNSGLPQFGTNPRMTVQVRRTDLPTFFARIWGRTQATVSASATAEAYNPTGANLSLGAGGPVATSCVKPWLLPNLDSSGTPIFNGSTGALQSTDPIGASISTLQPACDSCVSLPPASSWKFYPANQSSLPAPTQSLPTCSAGFNAYQSSIAGCVQTAIACGDGAVVNSSVDIDQAIYSPSGIDRTQDTADAVNCLTHSLSGNGDTIETSAGPSPPFQFVAGADNPVVGAIGNDVQVSDSLVTVPVFNGAPSSSVQVIGFVQLFLNPDGLTASGPVKATIINYSGCGATATGQPVLGNGASAIPVRLISQ